jgi:phosphoglycolate phosphatase-like HAD superfamily hydrolase
MNSKKVIFWDFDGVILNSLEIRDRGFRKVLKSYPSDEVDKLMEFHNLNGGLSRYVKFRYFFEKIRNESITETEVRQWANSFSLIMKKSLIDTSLLIEDSVAFIKENHNKYQMHIVSGSDGIELRYLCEKLGLSNYFISIHGSPIPKIKLVSDLLELHHYKNNNVILIGDSMNDYEAAHLNEILFYGFNNNLLKQFNYINTFKNFKF